MLTPTPYIVKMFGYIALDMQTSINIPVHYEHGHPIEIDNVLQAWEKSGLSAVKYPLLALFQDYDETIGEGNGVMCNAKFELIIATRSEPNYTADQRMINTFVPILYPLYRQFLKSLANSGYFFDYPANKIQHTKTDRLFWGKNKNAAFGDYVDAIHIQNLQLKIKSFKCS